MIALLAALVLAAHPLPSTADVPPFFRLERDELERGAGKRETVDAVARRYGLAGEILVAKGKRILLDRGYGTIDPEGGPPHRAGERCRLASITKQVTAALIVEAWASETTSLDAVSTTGRDSQPSLRQYLTHHTGLANPDTTMPDAAGVRSFYRAAAPDRNYCGSKPGVPGAPFSYNNCDYILAATFLSPAGEDEPRWPAGMAMAQHDERGVPGFVGGKPEPAGFQLASWGAAGGLMGTAGAVYSFDRSLMTGSLVHAAVRDAELWKPEGHGSYQALGAWVFPGRLKGYAAPKRIVQRDGEIYGVQARDYILPDDDLVVIVFTHRSADDFAIGEVWEGKGFAFDLLSAAACPA